MSITLTAEQEKLIQNLLATGRFNDVAEVIQVALSLLEQDSFSYHTWLDETCTLVDKGIASLKQKIAGDFAAKNVRDASYLSMTNKMLRTSA